MTQAFPLLLLLAQSPSPQPEVKIERLTWAKDVGGESPIRTIEVHNDFGDVRARLAPDRRLEMLAVVQRLDPGPEGVGFTVERRGDVVALTVAYPPGRVKDAVPDPPKASYDRLDLVIFIPEGVTFSAHTLRGLVEVRGLKSDVRAATRDGLIRVATSGSVQARTDSGEITASLDRSEGTGPLILQSVSGPIQAILAPAQGVDLEVHTSGRVTSDFPLKDEKGRRVGRRQGGPPRTLFIASRTGSVDLRRSDR
jgi:hypothetical protein